MSREEIESRHKKELKALDGEKRAALKKAKALKGKKGKDAIERYVEVWFLPFFVLSTWRNAWTHIVR